MGTGAKRAADELDFDLRLVGVNHWETAILTSRRNHPAATFLCADLHHKSPLDAVPGGFLDLLLAAPSCTYHSRARGGRPVYDQQRTDPWIVVRWCTELRVKRLLVENVPEFMKWGPCDVRTGRPIKSRQGEYFRAWIAAIEGCGFKLDYKIVCCADYGDVTTRERFLMMGRSDGKRLLRPDPSHSELGGADMFSTRAPWRPIAGCIDWDDLGISLFGRKKPLVHKTISRLYSGARSERWPRQHVDALEALLDGAEPRLEVTEDEAREIAERLGVSLVMSTASGGAARSTSSPMPAITTGGNGARPHFATPILASYYGSGSGLTAKSVREPVPSITTKARFGLASPFIIPITHAGRRPHCTIDRPIKTITGANRGEFAIARPGLAGYSIDVLYRMLRWRELARATSFDDEGQVYDFAGNATDITKQIGNAVPIRTVKAHVRALLEGT